MPSLVPCTGGSLTLKHLSLVSVSVPTIKRSSPRVALPLHQLTLLATFVVEKVNGICTEGDYEAVTAAYEEAAIDGKPADISL